MTDFKELCKQLCSMFFKDEPIAQGVGVDSLMSVIKFFVNEENLFIPDINPRFIKDSYGNTKVIWAQNYICNFSVLYDSEPVESYDIDSLRKFNDNVLQIKFLDNGKHYEYLLVNRTKSQCEGVMLSQNYNFATIEGVVTRLELDKIIKKEKWLA